MLASVCCSPVVSCVCSKGKNVAFERRRQHFAARHRAVVGQRVQLLERLVDDLARPYAGVHQPLDRAELGQLARRILTLAVFIPRGLWEAVAALPHSEDILRKTAFALGCADVELESLGFGGRIHSCCWIRGLLLYRNRSICPRQ
jgi:hypothetical protein